MKAMASTAVPAAIASCGIHSGVASLAVETSSNCHDCQTSRALYQANSNASALALLFAWYSARLVWQSWQFDDVSTANDATPLWIPQLAMAAGTAVLAIAFIDELVLELRGKRVAVASDEMLHNE